MKEIKRYQECSWIVRLYRRLRWQPFYFLKATFYATKAFFSKKPSADPELTFKLIYAEWNSKVNWYYTPEEVFECLREAINSKKHKR